MAEYNNLMAGKTAEIKAATAELEEKQGRVAAQVQKKADGEEDLEDTQSALDAANTYLTNLRKGCDDKKKEFETNEGLRQEETVAIQDTIKMLNDDDALDLFKKTLPSPEVAPAAAFIQMGLKTVRHHHVGYSTAFVQTAMQSGAAKFDKLKGMVGAMIATMASDQKVDDEQYAFCKKETAKVEDALTDVKENLKSVSQKQKEVENEVAVVNGEIAKLKQEIAELDSAVAEATAQRKNENAMFQQAMAEMNMASSLLTKAKERMA